MSKPVMQRLYDSEINFEIQTFWDGGFDARLGDSMNGFRAETCVRTWDEVEAWLDEQARRHFPDSKYARTRRSEPEGE